MKDFPANSASLSSYRNRGYASTIEGTPQARTGLQKKRAATGLASSSRSQQNARCGLAHRFKS